MSYGSMTTRRRGASCNHIAADAIVILEVFTKKSQQTPKAVFEACRRRLAMYQRLVKEGE